MIDATKLVDKRQYYINGWTFPVTWCAGERWFLSFFNSNYGLDMVDNLVLIPTEAELAAMRENERIHSITKIGYDKLMAQNLAMREIVEAVAAMPADGSRVQPLPVFIIKARKLLKGRDDA